MSLLFYFVDSLIMYDAAYSLIVPVLLPLSHESRVGAQMQLEERGNDLWMI